MGALRSSVIVAALISAPLVIDVGSHGAISPIGSAYAQQGKPEDPGGGNQGGNPNAPGGGKPVSPGKGKGDLYADLIVVWRDAQGRPILVQKDLLPETEGGESPGTVFCLQPISAAPVSGYPTITNPADGKSVSPVELGTGVPGEECDVNPDPDNVALVQEVLFGRLNLGRSPTKVLAQQLREVTSVLASSADPVQIDEAGRFVWYDSSGTGFEVDSPGNNLALHKELQVEGLPLVSQTQTEITLPAVANPDDPTGFLDHAAAALGAAAGKGDSINLDLVVYNNRILNIPNETNALNTVTGGQTGNCPDTWSSIGDQCQFGLEGELYINYGDTGVGSYGYTRSEVFPGCVRGYLADFPAPGELTPFNGEIMDCVFGSIDGSGTCSNGQDFTGTTALEGFAQRADDARAVIAFVHDNVVADSTAILPASQAGVDKAGDDAVCTEIEGGAALPTNAPTRLRQGQ